jgi:hypothetical protein
MLQDCTENSLAKICTKVEIREKLAVDKSLSKQLKVLQEVEKTFLSKY